MSPPRVLRLPRTTESLLEAHSYIAEHSPYASGAAADRFLASVEQTLAMLAAMPGLGRRWSRRVRVFPVKHFEKWLIFYAPLPDGIIFLAVFHGARDLPRHFEEYDAGRD